MSDFHNPHDHYLHQTPLNLVSLLDAWHALGERPLPASFARHLLRISKEMTLEEWQAAVQASAIDEDQARQMQAALRSLLEEPGQAAHIARAADLSLHRQPAVRDGLLERH